MISYLEKILKNKKKITIGVSIIALLVVIGGAFVSYTIKSNMNYTKDDCRAIALEIVSGEVVREETEIDFERAAVEYKFTIKDNNHLLREVEVDSKLGAIIDLD